MPSIWYVGSANARVIGTNDWASVGITGRPESRWDRINGYSISRVEFSQAQVNLLELDPDFDVNAPDTPRDPPVPQPPTILTSANLYQYIESMGFVRKGRGSPLNVVIAPVGTEYIDVDGTSGARKWYKAVGTGNTGWIVVDGDTGWRDITSLLHADFAKADSVGRIALRRIGDVVYFEGRIKRVGTGNLVAAMPTGFAGIGYNSRGMFERISPFAVGSLASSSGPASMQLFGSTPAGPDAVNTIYSFSVNFSTMHAWPVNLPGAAA